MTTPRLSIGLPVYNGENFLVATLQHLLRQTYRDFELILSDNCSTDRTAEICREAAEADSRVRYERSPENRGAAYNYNHTVELARGELFKWSAHDDLCGEDYLARCVALLDDDRETIVAHTKTLRIDPDHRVTGIYRSEVSFDDATPRERLRRVICLPHHCWAVFGVMRTDVLRRTARIGPFVGSDRNLLAELSLYGKIRLIAEPLFFHRVHPDVTLRRYPDERERLAWFDPRLAGRVSFPTWRRMAEYLAAIRRSPLSWREKRRCEGEILRWLSGRHHTGDRIAAMLARDVRNGLRARVALSRSQQADSEPERETPKESPDG